MFIVALTDCQSGCACSLFCNAELVSLLDLQIISLRKIELVVCVLVVCLFCVL